MAKCEGLALVTIARIEKLSRLLRDTSKGCNKLCAMNLRLYFFVDDSLYLGGNVCYRWGVHVVYAYNYCEC